MDTNIGVSRICAETTRFGQETPGNFESLPAYLWPTTFHPDYDFPRFDTAHDRGWKGRIEFPLKARSLASFERYSHALKSSWNIWDDRSLGCWLTDPQRAVPKSEMPFEGFNLREPPPIERSLSASRAMLIARRTLFVVCCALIGLARIRR